MSATREPSCGCTILELPEGEVEPGDTVTVTVYFDAHDTLGLQNEFLTLFLNNNEGIKVIFIGANVIKK